MAVWFMALNTAFGFGKKRFARLKEAFDKHTRDVMDFDYLGNHYVSLEDYANYLNKKYGCDIDVDLSLIHIFALVMSVVVTENADYISGIYQIWLTKIFVNSGA